MRRFLTIAALAAATIFSTSAQAEYDPAAYASTQASMFEATDTYLVGLMRAGSFTTACFPGESQDFLNTSKKVSKDVVRSMSRLGYDPRSRIDEDQAAAEMMIWFMARPEFCSLDDLKQLFMDNEANLEALTTAVKAHQIHAEKHDKTFSTP